MDKQNLKRQIEHCREHARMHLRIAKDWEDCGNYREAAESLAEAQRLRESAERMERDLPA